MKKKFIFSMFFCLLALISVSAFVSCTKYDVINVDANEWAIVVPYYGDQKEQAKNTDLTEDFIKQNLISNQRVVVPYKKVYVYGTDSIQVPTAKVYVAPRTPHSHNWYSENKDVDGKATTVHGDRDGIAIESKNSIGATIGISATFKIVDPVKYFFYKSTAGDFDKMIDTDGYTSAQNICTLFACSRDELTLIADKQLLVKTINDELNTTFGQFGIAVTNVGIPGGIQWDNPDIQKKLDARMIAATEKATAQDEVSAEQARQALIPLKRQWAEVDLLEAKAKYINAAADKGINLTPQVVGSGSSLLIDVSK